MKRAFSGFKIKCALDDYNEILGYENLKPHEAECFEKLIPCEYCKEKIKRLELERHMVSGFTLICNSQNPLVQHVKSVN